MVGQGFSRLTFDLVFLSSETTHIHHVSDLFMKGIIVQAWPIFPDHAPPSKVYSPIHTYEIDCSMDACAMEDSDRTSPCMCMSSILLPGNEDVGIVLIIPQTVKAHRTDSSDATRNTHTNRLSPADAEYK